MSRTGMPCATFSLSCQAIYLVNREPVPEALAWIDSEIAVMLAMQRPDGLVEDWYGEGNVNRTALLYACMKVRR